MLLRGFDSKLMYKANPGWSDGRTKAHEWVLIRTICEDDLVLKLKEIVEWCFANWNVDPHFDHEWYFVMQMETELGFNYEDLQWRESSLEGIRFGLGTDDDEWAVMFKLRWADFIETTDW